MIIRQNAAAVAIVLLCASFAAPAAAQTREPVTARVETADLNLSTNEGVARLRHRLDAAIANACVSSLSGVAGAMDASHCRQEMRMDAAPRLAAAMHGAPVAVASR